MAEETVPPPAAWHAGIEGADLGVLQTRGWDKLDAPAAARAMLAWGQEAESKLAWPSTEIVRWPKEPANDPEGMKAIYKRLGVPDTAEGYDYSALKFADGKPLDPKFVEPMRAAAAAANLSPAQMATVTQAVVKFMDDSTATVTRESAAAAANEVEALKTSWGANYDTNAFIAKRAATAMGIPEADFEGAMKAMGVGTAKAMGVLHRLGVAMGEARFITPENAGGTGVMTVEQAQARLVDINKDSAWQKRYFEGGSDERKELNDLQTLIVRARMNSRAS